MLDRWAAAIEQNQRLSAMQSQYEEERSTVPKPELIEAREYRSQLDEMFTRMKQVEQSMSGKGGSPAARILMMATDAAKSIGRAASDLGALAVGLQHDARNLQPHRGAVEFVESEHQRWLAEQAKAADDDVEALERKLAAARARSAE